MHKTASDSTIVILGRGYVGWSPTVWFGKQFNTPGFDIKTQRIKELRVGNDRTLKISPEELAQATWLTLQP